MTRDDPVSAALWQFFGAYFHEDWDLEADNSDEIVANFLTENTPTSEQLRILATGLDRLIESYSESELAKVLFDEWGSYYRVLPPETYKSWLAEMAARLRREAEDGNPTQSRSL